MEFVQPIRSKKQLDNMKRYLKEKSMRDFVLFVIGINSGLRVSDLLTLTVGDVRGKDRIILREKKTGKTKSFPLSETAKKALNEYLKDIDTGVLFPSRKGGKAITRQQAYNVLNEAAQAVGIKEAIGTHTLRKTFGYHAYKAGVSLEIIQKLLNHTSPSVTLRYIGITQEELDDVYLTLNL